MSTFAFIILSLAVYRLTRLLIQDELLSGPRDWFWSKYPPETTKMGYMLTCAWCIGFWVSVVVVTLYLLFNPVMMVVALILAVSAVVGILDTLLNR